jgi:hypothetical protein
MPGRSPESAERSSRVAKAIRAEMKHQGLTGPELTARIERIRGARLPNGMWLSRRLTGKTNLVEPVKVVYGPTADLMVIAEALGVKPARLVRVTNLTKPAAGRSSADADDGFHVRRSAPADTEGS